MTKSFSLSLVVASACLAGTGGCTASTESKPADKSEASADVTDEANTEAAAADGDAAAAKTSGAQKRTPTGTVNAHAAAARPAVDEGRRAAAAPGSASGASHAVRPAQPTASASGDRTAIASTGGAMAKPAADEDGTGNDVELRGARVSRAVPAVSADGRVDNAARMLQLEAGEGDSAG